METRYETYEEFYRADERRRRSPEADYGVNWIMEGRRVANNPARHRISYIRATGEIYIVQNFNGPVTILGSYPVDEVAPTEIYYKSLDAVLEGWPEQCGQPGGLQWVRGRLAQSDRGTVTPTREAPYANLMVEARNYINASRAHDIHGDDPKVAQELILAENRLEEALRVAGEVVTS